MSRRPRRGLRAALAAWREHVAAAREQAGPTGWERSVRRLHVLAHRQHGATQRDPRRRHWRRYLAETGDDD